MDFNDPTRWIALSDYTGIPLHYRPDSIRVRCETPARKGYEAEQQEWLARWNRPALPDAPERCTAPYPISQRQARAWCQSFGWAYIAHDGRGRVSCRVGGLV